ncbi:alpha-ketoglutarate-dependent dioxygenase AlkB [Lewinella lacunae]|uniref:Alpha-ketoglutarate-dependent dioxygenase AlkB n=2 Tax=Neolewinella lacunae TaxID=1517758 RepID=A0A923TCA5_9BACT|nr:alpha-ketoglutarate-dependent dioxygenase AlkB [Neolewinella lacunae]
MEKNTNEKIILKLDEDHEITIYRGIQEFQLSAPDFKHLWESHPSEFHEVMMHGKLVKTPRWQQAYGKSYEYTGSKNNALPITEEHLKYLAWCKKEVDDRINGLLINWYSGELQHYIGKHRDSTKGLMSGSPIVTISHGGERVFRFRPFRGEGFMDITVEDGDVVIVPWKTNKSFTHEVPYHKKFTKDRISITLRAYE